MHQALEPSRKRAPLGAAAAAWLALSAALAPEPVRAEDSASEPDPATFSYTQPADANFVRALLEMTGVMALGFIWYVTTTDIVHDYDVAYRWPIFRRKLLGEALELDTNRFNTNFIGHPLGGTMYYTSARSNQLSAAEAAAFAFGGSLVWEYFGEVHEIVSINDMIVTPLAGIAIAEPMLQLGAFFDRSSPVLRHQILAWLFAPLKSLNDQLDRRTLARAAHFDEHGFPRDEWHRFDLRLGAARTSEGPAAKGGASGVSDEVRLSVSSQLVRLSGYDAAVERSRLFSDANLSHIHVDAAWTSAGLVDLDLATQAAFLGTWNRRAGCDGSGRVWGQGVVVALSMGFQYTLHDYDRDRARPKDLIASVQPLGVLIEHRAALGDVRLLVRLAGGADFGGVRPYAAQAFALTAPPQSVPFLVTEHGYYFAAGGHALASASVDYAELLEASAKLRYERFSEIGVPVAIEDQRMLLEARIAIALGATPGRVSLLAQRRSRSGFMGGARAERAETTLGVELGATY